MTNKLVVHYKPPLFIPDWTKGYKVYVVDHPRLGCRMIETSPVTKDYGNGIFETQWAVYHPLDGDFNDT